MWQEYRLCAETDCRKIICSLLRYVLQITVEFRKIMWYDIVVSKKAVVSGIFPEKRHSGKGEHNEGNKAHQDSQQC